MLEQINDFFGIFVGFLAPILFMKINGFPLIVLVLLFGCLIFTVYFKFINCSVYISMFGCDTYVVCYTDESP